MAQKERLPVPDPSLYWTGEENPRRGPRQCRLLLDWGLTPASDVLEIGCGTGRLAYELADELVEGSYVGFDIAPDPIEWLQRNYAAVLPNFRFDHFDFANPRFRPEGSLDVGEARFPYEDGQFDLVCAFDVFMHLQLPGIVTYLREIRRVLRPGGRCVMTWLVINERDDQPVFAGRPFVPLGEGVHTRFPERPGVSMAYDDVLVRGLIDDAGLTIIEAVEGRWHRPLVKREGNVPGADLFVASG